MQADGVKLAGDRLSDADSRITGEKGGEHELSAAGSVVREACPDGQQLGSSNRQAPSEYNIEEELATQRAIVEAQRWDIAGLKEQLTAATEKQQAAEARLALLEREHAALQKCHRAAAASGRLWRMLLQRLRGGTFANVWVLSTGAAGIKPKLFLHLAVISESGLFDEDYYRRQCRPGEIPENMPAIEHYVRFGDEQGRDPHPLFEVAFYRRQLADDQRHENALVHYLTAGKSLQPNPLFLPNYYAAQYPELAGTGINPLVHYVEIGVGDEANPHPLFDAKYYRAELAKQGVSQPGNPLIHYFAEPIAEVSPHPLFDAPFYLGRHPEVSGSGYPPLVHYLLEGEHLGWDPHKWFWLRYYRERYSEAAAPGVSALLHYVTQGATRDYSPVPIFDPAFYRLKNSDTGSGVAAFLHFLEVGCSEARQVHPIIDLGHVLPQLHRRGLPTVDPLRILLSADHANEISPHLLFDPQYYIANVPAAGDYRGGPLLFYLAEGKQLDQGPHPLFDPRYYRSQLAAREIKTNDPLTHFLLVGNELGASPHPLFDTDYYLTKNPDLAKAGVSALEHYLTAGYLENHRDPHPLFSTSFYKRQAGIGAVDNALLHYLGSGGKVDPHPLFDTRYYLALLRHRLPAGTTPLVHYLTSREGAQISPFPLFDQQYVLKQMDASEDAGVRPILVDYLKQSAETAPSPHPLFDLAFFHETVGYLEPALLEYVMTLRNLSAGGYQLHQMHFQEANRHFCSISYLLAHPELLESFEVPMAHFARTSDWRRFVATVEAPMATPARGDVKEGDHPKFYHPLAYGNAALAVTVRDRLQSGLKYLGEADPELQRAANGGDGNLAALFEATQPYANVAGDDPMLVTKVAKSGRFAVYAVYTPDGKLASYHEAVLADLRKAGYCTVLVNSAVEGAERLAIQAKELADAVVVRSGEGRDFASWIVAIAHYLPVVRHAEHVVLINDSLVGPFDELPPILRALERDPADFKGLTDSFETAYHLQSSFLMLSDHALFSRAFLQFMLDFEAAPREAGALREPGGAFARRASARRAIVRLGELELSSRLIAAGISTNVHLPFDTAVRSWLGHVPTLMRWAHKMPQRLARPEAAEWLSAEIGARLATYVEEWLFERAIRLRAGERANPQHVLWDALLRSGRFPFVKKELLLANPLHVPTIVALIDQFPESKRMEFRDLLSKLVRRPNGMPPAYFRLSDALLDLNPA